MHPCSGWFEHSIEQGIDGSGGHVTSKLRGEVRREDREVERVPESDDRDDRQQRGLEPALRPRVGPHLDDVAAPDRFVRGGR